MVCSVDCAATHCERIAVSHCPKVQFAAAVAPPMVRTPYAGEAMHPFRSVVLAGALATVAASAHAGAGIVQATMTPLSPTVTYAADAVRGAPALVTYIGYTLLTTNIGGNTV